MPPDNEPTVVFPLLILSSQSVQSQQAEFLMKLSHATLDFVYRIELILIGTLDFYIKG